MDTRTSSLPKTQQWIDVISGKEIEMWPFACLFSYLALCKISIRLPEILPVLTFTSKWKSGDLVFIFKGNKWSED